MRVGVSSRGRAWVSMGCVGWLIFGPFILCMYAAVIAAQLAWLLLVVAPVQLVRWIIAERAA